MTAANFIVPVLLAAGIGAAATMPHWSGMSGRGGFDPSGRCRATVNSGAWSATSPSRAETRALIAWTESVGKRHGASYAAWHNAAAREIECSESDKGVFRCVASGHPCETGHRIAAAPQQFY